ncbi:Antitrypsin [Altererythrobacter insulae]|nr:Antitrypsin [Altererythrobacter insulae]
MKRLLCVLVPLALAACVTPVSHNNQIDFVSAESPSGAMALLPLLDADAGADKNVVYSPASVDQAFGLLRLGAKADTAAELDRILPAPANADFLRSDKDDVEVRLANALFLSKDFDFNRAFVSAAKSRYDATTQAVDFEAPEATSDTINAWADEATDGLIPKVMAPEAIKPEMIAVLANALYFDGKWETKLTGGDKRKFLFGDGSEKDFVFVGKVLSLKAAKIDGWQAVRLPYSNDRYAMDVIMPDQRRVMDEALSPARIAKFGNALDTAEAQLTDLLIPQFEVDYETSLIAPLKALGLIAPFTDGMADLSGLAESGQRNIIVSDARHVTKLQVFDVGTRAAAVTTISIILTAGRVFETPPVPFHADRPFMFVIRDLETDTILFVGRIADPQEFTPEVEEY